MKDVDDDTDAAIPPATLTRLPPDALDRCSPADDCPAPLKNVAPLREWKHHHYAGVAADANSANDVCCRSVIFSFIIILDRHLLIYFFFFLFFIILILDTIFLHDSHTFSWESSSSLPLLLPPFLIHFFIFVIGFSILYLLLHFTRPQTGNFHWALFIVVFGTALLKFLH